MRHRREQSDRASSEIGKRLLQGWTMLGDECSNEGCYGIPLVGPPRSAATAKKVIHEYISSAGLTISKGMRNMRNDLQDRSRLGRKTDFNS
jgi:hypothetical protein